MQRFASGNAVAGGCCNYLFCTSREWYVWRCVGFRARNPYGLLRSSLASEPATFTARICMHGLAGFLHARASGHGGVKKGKVTVDTHGENYHTGVPASAAGLAALSGARWVESSGRFFECCTWGSCLRLTKEKGKTGGLIGKTGGLTK